MRTDDVIMIRSLLESDEYRLGNFAPIEYFSIVSGIFNLLESLENAEMNFSLGTIETEIMSLCALSEGNALLESYVHELRELISSDFSLDKLQRCKAIFSDMREVYIGKYAKPIMLMEVG